MFKLYMSEMCSRTKNTIYLKCIYYIILFYLFYVIYIAFVVENWISLYE